MREVPVVALDNDRSAQSRELLRNIDATPDAHIVAYAADMEEAKAAMKRREAYGIINVPRTFAADLAASKQTTVSAFSDMSSMLYYKAVYTSALNASLKMNAKLKVERTPGATQEQARVVEHPIEYEDICLYNPQNGFASFLIPPCWCLCCSKRCCSASEWRLARAASATRGICSCQQGCKPPTPYPSYWAKPRCT